MKKRTFLKTAGLLGLGLGLGPWLQGCSSASKGGEESGKGEQTSNVAPFDLPPLPYSAQALEPHIDAETMNLHHGKHHAGYVSNLNKALENHALAKANLTEILAQVKPEEAALRNNAGGHYNHSLFWQILNPKRKFDQPQGVLKTAIEANFGSFENLVEALSKAALGQFGSGWAWLCQDVESKKLFISSTANQDNPLMTQIVKERGKPLLGIDVWEHAYYLNYQNRRKDYVEAVFKLLDWELIAQGLIS